MEHNKSVCGSTDQDYACCNSEGQKLNLLLELVET